MFDRISAIVRNVRLSFPLNKFRSNHHLVYLDAETFAFVIFANILQLSFRHSRRSIISGSCLSRIFRAPTAAKDFTFELCDVHSAMKSKKIDSLELNSADTLRVVFSLRFRVCSRV